MDFFFEPNGIAVVGGTPEPYTGGRNLLTNITLGYKGPFYHVNPKYDEIVGLKCYPRVSEIIDPLDLCVIFVPAKAVPQVMEDCLAKGVRGVIIESGGFAEVGTEGKTLQDQCLAIARKKAAATSSTKSARGIGCVNVSRGCVAILRSHLPLDDPVPARAAEVGEIGERRTATRRDRGRGPSVLADDTEHVMRRVL